MHDADQAAVSGSLPVPWVRGQVHAVGGLFQVGFASGRDLLLVHSSQGRGLFDTISGRRIARDDEEPMDGFDPVRLLADGFDAIDGKTLRMAGLFGGGLPWTTSDGYRLDEDIAGWPQRRIMLHAPDRSRMLVATDGACELRAFGFSETGRSFVVATSCELMSFSRQGRPVSA